MVAPVLPVVEGRIVWDRQATCTFGLPEYLSANGALRMLTITMVTTEFSRFRCER